MKEKSPYNAILELSCLLPEKWNFSLKVNHEDSVIHFVLHNADVDLFKEIENRILGDHLHKHFNANSKTAMAKRINNVKQNAYVNIEENYLDKYFNESLEIFKKIFNILHEEGQHQYQVNVSIGTKDHPFIYIKPD